MGLFNKMFRKSKKTKADKQGNTDLRGNYSFVKNPDGKILGLWIKNTDLSEKTAALVTLLKSHQGRTAEIRMPISEDHINMVISHNYRVVSNNIDQRGGCFVMFGQELAPGEDSERSVQSKPQGMETSKKNNTSLIFVFAVFPISFSSNMKETFHENNQERITKTLKDRYDAHEADLVFIKDWKCKDITWEDNSDLKNKIPEFVEGINQVLTQSGVTGIEPEVLVKSCYFAIDPETSALIIALPMAT